MAGKTAPVDDRTRGLSQEIDRALIMVVRSRIERDPIFSRIAARGLNNLVYKDVIYDWYAASDREYSGYHPSDLLPWNTILWAKGNNLKTYDFAGAGKPNKDYSVRDYKLKFGGKLLNFGRYQCIHKPLLYKLGVFGLKAYQYLKWK